MESKSAETSTGASAEIVLSIIGGGYFFVMITRFRSISCKCTMDYIVSVASALQEKSTKNDVSESDTSKKVNINNLDSCHQTASPARENNSAPPADNSRPENLTDEEWQLVQMARQEKRQASQTSSSTSSDIA